MSSSYSQHDLPLFLLPPLLTAGTNLRVTLVTELKTTTTCNQLQRTEKRTLLCTLWILGVRWMISKSTAAIKKATKHITTIIYINYNITYNNNNYHTSFIAAKDIVLCCDQVNTNLHQHSTGNIDINSTEGIYITQTTTVILLASTSIGSKATATIQYISTTSKQSLLSSLSPLILSLSLLSTNNPPVTAVEYWTTIRYLDFGKNRSPAESSSTFDALPSSTSSSSKGEEGGGYNRVAATDSANYIQQPRIIPIEEHCKEKNPLKEQNQKYSKRTATFYGHCKQRQYRCNNFQQLFIVAFVKSKGTKEDEQEEIVQTDGEIEATLEEYLHIVSNSFVTVAVLLLLLLVFLLPWIILTVKVAGITKLSILVLGGATVLLVLVEGHIYCVADTLLLLPKFFIESTKKPNNYINNNDHLCKDNNLKQSNSSSNYGNSSNIKNIEDNNNNIDRGCIYYSIIPSSERLLVIRQKSSGIQKEGGVKQEEQKKEKKGETYSELRQPVVGIKKFVDRQQINCDHTIDRKGVSFSITETAVKVTTDIYLLSSLPSLNWNKIVLVEQRHEQKEAFTEEHFQFGIQKWWFHSPQTEEAVESSPPAELLSTFSSILIAQFTLC